VPEVAIAAFGVLGDSKRKIPLKFWYYNIHGLSSGFPKLKFAGRRFGSISLTARPSEGKGMRFS
jgi:hypothetical protein